MTKEKIESFCVAPVTWRQQEFLKQFNKNYSFLYENHDRVAGYDEARDFFDDAMQKSPAFKAFVIRMVRARGDIFSSDREAAAFAFTCSDFGLI